MNNSHEAAGGKLLVFVEGVIAIIKTFYDKNSKLM